MREQVSIMGVPIDKVTKTTALNQFINLMTKNKCGIIFTPNTEIVMQAQNDQELLTAIKSADLVIPDGIGLIYASKILKKGLQERVTGVDLMYEILSYCNKNHNSIYIIGGKSGVAELAGKNIQSTFPNICVAGTRDGYFQEDEEEKIVQQINACHVDVLFVALGAPKQEKWIYKHKSELKTKVAMGVGGSVDIWAGTVKRAPEIYQKLGLEWFYRLLKEPWRYKRMMVLPKFMIKVLLYRQS